MLCGITMMNISCKQHNGTAPTAETEYLIFGHFYGFCHGEQCIEIFKLSATQVLEDTTDVYPSSSDFYNGKFIALSQAKFDSVQTIVNFFPTDLLSEPNTVIGQPDAGDGGGLYIEYNYNGTRKFWLLDKMKNNVPTKYHEFIDEVNRRVEMLQ